MIKNFSNYIWGYKTVIGSKDSFAPSLSTRVKNSDDRAIFPVSYNQKDYNIDAELALSLVLEYLYYTFLKDDSVDYDSYPYMMDELLTKPHEVVIAVCSLLSQDLDSPVLHSLERAWTRSGPCHEQAGGCVVHSGKCGRGAGIRLLQGHAQRVPRPGLHGALLRHGHVLHDPHNRPVFQRSDTLHREQ